MPSVQDTLNKIDEAFNTPGGVPELAALKSILRDEAILIRERGVYVCKFKSNLPYLSPASASVALVAGVGIYYFSPNPVVPDTDVSAAGAGWWVLTADFRNAFESFTDFSSVGTTGVSVLSRTGDERAGIITVKFPSSGTPGAMVGNIALTFSAIRPATPVSLASVDVPHTVNVSADKSKVTLSISGGHPDGVAVVNYLIH